MDFDLSEDQQALSAAFEQLADRHRELPVGHGGFVQTSPALERELAEAGFLGVAREDGCGASEAVLLIEALGRSPYAVEVAASALVAPLLTDRVLPGPIVLAQAPLGRPLRFLGERGTALIDTGEDVRVVDVASAQVEAVPSPYNYPFGRFVDLEPSRQPVLEGVTVERFRQLWRLALAAEIVAASRPALDLTVEHVKVRKQFGRPLGAFQVIQHRLAECLVLIEGATMLVREAAATLDHAPEAAAIACAYTQAAAAKIIQETHQFHGAVGLTLEYPLHYWTYRLRMLQGELGGQSAQSVAASRMLWPKDRSIADQFHGQDIGPKRPEVVSSAA